LFAYGPKKLDELPDTLNLKLLNNDEKFTLTYYGNVNSNFGQRWGRKHEGLDLALHLYDSVFAAFDGIVRFAKCTNCGYGNCVIIRHLNGLETLYGHLSKINVFENQFVKSGETIGLGGSTGYSTGPHLHFETRLNDFSFNPQKIIDIKNKKLFNDSISFSKKTLFSERYYPEPHIVHGYSKTKRNIKSKNKYPASKKTKVKSESTKSLKKTKKKIVINQKVAAKNSKIKKSSKLTKKIVISKKQTSNHKSSNKPVPIKKKTAPKKGPSKAKNNKQKKKY
jgi:hypothetical protein